MASHDFSTDEAGKRVGKTSVFQGLQLMMVQSSVCVVSILVVLIFRWGGFAALDSMASLFREAMLDNTLITAVSSVVQTSVVSAQRNVLTAETVSPPFVGGVITSMYGERDGTFHEGVDIGMEEGEPLRALMNGIVSTVEFDENGYGHYVVVTVSDGSKYLYAHCKSVEVCTGQEVQAGQVIAFVGNTGRSSGSHLHFEWLECDKAVDPMEVLPAETYV